ncbi:DUF2508 family protein [Tepidibacter mesophilus]|uniref:DUF2508 family protein n=1 Tax=Tepidibacter mesophilus TaxID=655607 RepID=UPI000C07D6F0|nr:DUF2508 family protein [Tepidibacter mesophilus]
MSINFFKRQVDENEEFMMDLRDAYIDLKAAESFFDNVKDPDLVDYAIFRLEAAKSRYSYFLRKAKANGIISKGVCNV